MKAAKLFKLIIVLKLVIIFVWQSLVLHKRSFCILDNLMKMTKIVEKKRIDDPEILMTGTKDISSQFVTGLLKKVPLSKELFDKIGFS